MKRKISSLFGILLLAVLAWYFVIKPYDYLVRFEVKTTPSLLTQFIENWNEGFNSSKLLNQKNANNLSQKITINDSIYRYNWKITQTTDSSSKVRVYVKDLNHSLINKLKIPFSATDFEKTTKRTLIEFNKKLNDHLKKFKTKMVGRDTLKGTYCAYVHIKNARDKKARGMMQYYSLLDGFIFQNNIKLNGKPRVEITNWDTSKDSISYNFCYPIVKSDYLPGHDIIKYKQLEDTYGLKAIYNGNYINSDRAWYMIQDYALKNNIDIVSKPIEVFHNNPNMGGDGLSWKTEIFMPFQ